ncbi:hypothetical protein GLAREA_05284 [Glarea lozoyensis ATCC 20868]|uniref:Uncharacterized protein n=1 Tax=Glarea lozoyensis (strain ATCC 20868 / MF5171) TaxID=1116229 RepID=S3DVH5_GLAL2|nr:uncharacterized protein GLAREA_05284 [Glarea lozoyensis ATCC 20868]EPE35946.1 hypothetical protein GLAREA_05284 [Glarea lozoyensis ATCC 20868]
MTARNSRLGKSWKRLSQKVSGRATRRRIRFTKDLEEAASTADGSLAEMTGVDGSGSTAFLLPSSPSEVTGYPKLHACHLKITARKGGN